MKKYDPVKRLEARANLDARKMLEMLGKNAVRVKGLIIGAKDVQQARGREALFREVAAAFRVLGGNMDDLLKECAAATAMMSAKAVGQSLVDKAKDAGKSILKFSLERAKRYWRYVCPENSRGLAATSTDKMGADLIDTLRRAVVEVERQAAIEGWTMDEIRKAIEDKWAEVSKNDKNFKFVDKSGRAWENGRYCQMLARTTATRVWNDSYLDRLAEEGFQFVKVSQHGSEPDCDVCRAWAGKICMVAGKSDKYPTVEDARAAGVFHPNCMCTWEYVDEDEDKAELEKQALKAGEKVDWNDPKAVEKKNADNVARNAAKDDIIEQMDALGIKATKETAEKPLSGHPPPANPGWESLDYGHTNNCTRCVMAGYLRAQGYDVVARPLPNPPPRDDPYWYGKWATMWKDARESPVSTKSELLDAMKGYGDGAWAEVLVWWRNGGGHVFLARQRNGVTEFIDPQSGKSQYEPWARVRTIQYVRIDTLKPNEISRWVEKAKPMG